MNRPSPFPGGGFTLIEVLLASIAAALILAAIYSVFQQAMRLRDGAVLRIRDTQVRMRAASVIRNDLRNAFVSGGLFASVVEGDSANTDGLNSELPGYLKFTTTTGKDTPDDLYGDVQQVEYYVTKASGTAGGGTLVRSVTRDLLQTDQPQTEDQEILSDVASLQVAFYDGAAWETSWNYNSANSGTDSASTSGSDSDAQQTLPQAIRLDIQQNAISATDPSPAPLEVMVPWTTSPFTSPTPAPSATPASSTGPPEGEPSGPNPSSDEKKKRSQPGRNGGPGGDNGPGGPGGNGPGRGSEGGSVLIVVLVVCLGLVSLTLLLGHTVAMAYRGSDNEIAGREADSAIEGAARYAETILTNVEQPGEMPDPTTYQAEAVPLGLSTFWFIGEPLPGATQDTPAFSLVDEASKLNLNTASAAMLENLPGMTQELAQAIVTWRSASTSTSAQGAATTASSSEKNAPFETVEELAQVDPNVDLELLYGNDSNLNHVLEPSEASGGAGSLSPGLLEYVTVYSRLPNTSATSSRINVTNLSGALTQLLNTTFGSARGAQLTRRLRRAGPVKSVLEFYEKSGMTADELGKISTQLTASNGAFSKGLINVNTASQTVLDCVPGITDSVAAQIISARQNQTEPVTNLSWVASILGPQASVQAGPYLTAETYQISADVAAVGHNGRGYRRTLFVIDNSTGTPQIVFRRNLSSLGWALGSEARQTLASQNSSPASGAQQESRPQ